MYQPGRRAPREVPPHRPDCQPPRLTHEDYAVKMREHDTPSTRPMATLVSRGARARAEEIAREAGTTLEILQRSGQQPIWVNVRRAIARELRAMNLSSSQIGRIL